jgi:DNA-binding PadR family transcriptional regulator
MMLMLKTHNLRLVVSELLKSPDTEHYGNEIKRATGIETSSVYAVLSRLVVAGYLTDLGERPSDLGGSPRRVYRVADVEGLRALLSKFS